MTKDSLQKPKYIFETSWEICNMIGGIYTVISTKAPVIQKEYGNKYITIGPDVWKETQSNPDFTEDKTIFNTWTEKAAIEGLRIRLGRWNIKNSPVAILVDFTPLFAEKDKIFFHLWKKYRLDSLTGQWDYVEPALFGYAAGKVIESFYNFYLSHNDKVVAHFHEWMTGTGILYLNEHLPQVATVFTTHATTVGRTISGNGLPLYGQMDNYNGEEMAQQLGVISKFSLEKNAAANADCFTSVSNATASESKKLLLVVPDIVTPNGFSSSLIFPENVFLKKRKNARKKIFEIAEALFNTKVSKDTFLIITSGRYEFRNKGIDLFIDAIGKLSKKNPEKEIMAFVKIPANQTGPREDLLARIESPDFSHSLSEEYLTHNLYDEANDAIQNKICDNGLKNLPGDKVKIIFVPAYLNGNDGIFNLQYYDLLIGFDLTVFPSYYEPWGYTPLESIAFRIPTITTCQTGFGQWVEKNFRNKHKSIFIVDRKDDNEDDVIRQIDEGIRFFINLSADETNQIRDNAVNIAEKATWEKFFIFYQKAYSIALDKVENRKDKLHPVFKKTKKVYLTEALHKELPVWKKVIIEPSVPKKIAGLQELSKNLWWSWNYEAVELFEMIDKELWENVHQNPVILLKSLNIRQLHELEKNETFLKKYEKVYSCFKEYMSAGENKPEKQVAYFSMEYGLHQSLRIYSGGLGILAGDYLKEAGDSNINIVGIGLLYRYGYFQQSISIFGDQVAHYKLQNFSNLPITKIKNDEGEEIKIKIVLPGRTLFARIWRVDVGRIPLYLLDTDFPDNSDADRTITHKLYGGDSEYRLKQEMLLGIGGIRMLNVLGIKPDICHINEGHSAFISLERLRCLIRDEKLTFPQAYEVVRSSTLFTTHTPVPAGHDVFSEDLLRTYFPHYPENLKITWDEFMNMGRFTRNDTNEKFSMSVLAAKLSQEINGVSKIHGRVSQEMFAGLYDGYYPQENHIGYVTNGVHLPTWASKHWQKLYKKYLDKDILINQTETNLWQKIHEVMDNEIWNIRQKLKKDLIGYLKNRIRKDMTNRQENPKLIIRTIEAMDENALTIGFARRFATYKRARLVFSNPERLARILNIENRPMQFIYSGKAHPNDKAGQDLIKHIIEISKKPEFIGKIIFVENYDIELAKKLISGVDIWLNTPTRPLEASGTSGEKAVMNGVLNFSVLDGWWAEGYNRNAGWAIQEARTYANQQFQDELDAEIMYYVFEEEIIPLYYEKNAYGIPRDWIKYIKNTISEIAPRFTMKRMLEDYLQKYYYKLFDRAQMISENHFRKAQELVAWKTDMKQKWNGIKIERLLIPDSSKGPLTLENTFNTEVTLFTNGIPAENIGIEVLFGKKTNGIVDKILLSKELTMVKSEPNMAKYSVEVPLFKPGANNYALRLFPKNKLLAHRQDFNLIKWI